jgi:P27 family predicted phage terminase small subunit
VGARGPAPKPALEIVREGNPGHHSSERLARGVKVPPGRPPEPDWRSWFTPGRADGSPKRVRRRKAETDAEFEARQAKASAVDGACAEASEVWRWACGVLDAAGLISAVDLLVLTDLCVTWVRLAQAERDISTNGLRQLGERGWQRNGSITTAMAYRQQWKWLCGQLGLSPVARDGLKGGSDDDEDSPFDV